jgi:hypothetical protein
MKSRLTVPVVVAALFVLSGCSDQGAEPEEGTLQYTLQQIPGCGKTGSAKVSASDSCFTYTFDADLDISWCVPANCCPDSQRFALSCTVLHDTINVAVRDTAQNLCRCMCSYTIHARYADLPLDHYLVHVQYGDNILYREVIHRSR